MSKKRKWTQNSLQGGKEKEKKRKRKKERERKKDMLGYQRQKKGSGTKSPRGTGAGAQSLRTEQRGKLQGGRGEGQVGHPGCRMSRRGRMWDRETQNPAKPGREARGRLPTGRQTPREGSEGRPSPEDGHSAGLRSRVGGTLTNFLGLPPSPPVAGSSSGLRPFFLSRVPRPGPWPPPDGSMSWLAPASNPLSTPLQPGYAEPATTAAAQQPS